MSSGNVGKLERGKWKTFKESNITVHRPLKIGYLPTSVKEQVKRFESMTAPKKEIPISSIAQALRSTVSSVAPVIPMAMPPEPRYVSEAELQPGKSLIVAQEPEPPYMKMVTPPSPYTALLRPEPQVPKAPNVPPRALKTNVLAVMAAQNIQRASQSANKRINNFMKSNNLKKFMANETNKVKKASRKTRSNVRSKVANNIYQKLQEASRGQSPYLKPQNISNKTVKRILNTMQTEYKLPQVSRFFGAKKTQKLNNAALQRIRNAARLQQESTKINPIFEENTDRDGGYIKVGEEEDSNTTPS